MLIRVGSEYLDFDGDIDIDESVKLFEDISTVNGSFSYSFELPTTHNNIRILGIHLNSQIIKKHDCVIVSDTGEDIHHGYLVIEEVVNTIRTSFFSGNSYWFSLLNVSCQSFRLAHLDKAQANTTIEASWDETNGIVFPLVDNGTLTTRSSRYIYTADFMPFVHIKDVIKGMLNSVGVKLEGSILNDYVFNNAITTNNSRSTQQARIDRNKTFVSNGSNQTLTDGSTTLIEFDTTTSPFYNSSNSNWDSVNFRYNFTEGMRKAKVSYNIKITTPSGSILQVYKVYVYLDGNQLVRSENTVSGTQSSNNNLTISGSYELEAGSGNYIDLRIEYVNYLSSASAILLSGSTITVEPVKFYVIQADALLPNTKANEFIGDFLRLINGFCYYDFLSRTLTIDTLETVLSREPVDITQYIEIESVNFTEFSSEYAQNNILKYTESSFAEEFNKGRLVPYGGGNIQVNDDSLDYESDLFETNFIAAWHEDHPIFGNIAKLEYLELVEYNESNITSVSDSGGYAVFNYTGDLSGSGLMRIRDSTIEDYNGDWEINSNIPSTSVTSLDIPYLGNATAKVTNIDQVSLDNDEQAILIKSKGRTDLINNSNFYLDGIIKTSIAIGYFQYPINGKDFGNRHFQCLSFDPIDSNQTGLKQTYYRQTEQLLNSSMLVRVKATIPLTVYRSLDFLRPVTINTDRINGVFLLNRKLGYNGIMCNLELVKYG